METDSLDRVSCRSQSTVIQWAGLVAVAAIFCVVMDGLTAATVGFPVLAYGIQGRLNSLNPDRTFHFRYAKR